MPSDGVEVTPTQKSAYVMPRASTRPSGSPCPLTFRSISSYSSISAIAAGSPDAWLLGSLAAGGGQGYPALEGVKVDGHWAVIYSKYDIGCALERPQGLDCKGYTHESAVRVAANIVLYSMLP